MCGIAAYKGNHKCLSILKNILEKLEYRGYDSCGISYILGEQLITSKTVGCVKELIHNHLDLEEDSYIGIGHTRWATHGHLSVRNAHPHCTLDGRLSIVHNGIIENYNELKVELKENGHYFLSDTDSEVLLYLIYDYLIQNNINLFEATKLALNRVVGAYAIAVLDKNQKDTIVIARKGSPLVIGVGNDPEEYFVASDSKVLASFTTNIIYMEDNSIARLDKEILIHSLRNNKTISSNIVTVNHELYNITKLNFEHYMLKEIYEQPKAVLDCISGRLDGYQVKLGGLEDKKNELKNISRILILGCGSSYYAGLLGKYYIEEFCNIPTTVEYAGEFANRKPAIQKNDIIIAISQSGETSDLIKAIELAKNKGAFIVGICNAADSSLSRITDCGVFCKAGVEIGVASTKSFVSQSVVLLLIALWLDQCNKKYLAHEYRSIIISTLKKLPEYIKQVLQMNLGIKNLAYKHFKFKKFCFIGREYNYPIALEGALKLKEICYVNAEGYAGSELKHGPLSLIDKSVLTIAISNNSKQHTKINNNIQEIITRNGKIIEICNSKKTQDECFFVLPEIIDPLSPLLSVIILQLFSYYCAIFSGYDPDKPRNLAKSVTVE